MGYLLGYIAILLLGSSADPPRIETTAAKLGIPFDRYLTRDSLGRTITFYLSTRPHSPSSAKLPVVLFIGGSGCQSLFRKLGEHVGGGPQNLLLAQAKGRVRVLAVEKLGVKYLDAPDQPGSAVGGTEEFLKEHALSRWAEANIAALKAVWALPEIDASRSLVVGHSEGGIVAARVAAELPQVTHVASLAGGGPSQLFDFVFRASQAGPEDKPGDAARRVQEVHDEWAKIQKSPDSISQFWLGHPYRRWSSFLASSVLQELLRTKARIYVAHGTRDTSVPVVSYDILVTELSTHRREVTCERLEGADHGFQTEDMPKGPPVGLQALIGRLLAWFLS
jgi:pimeloyl-ACP methyl ester carboxylesterase